MRLGDLDESRGLITGRGRGLLDEERDPPLDY